MQRIQITQRKQKTQVRDTFNGQHAMVNKQIDEEQLEDRWPFMTQRDEENMFRENSKKSRRKSATEAAHVDRDVCVVSKHAAPTKTDRSHTEQTSFQPKIQRDISLNS